jgi:hypothetical protein
MAACWLTRFGMDNPVSLIEVSSGLAHFLEANIVKLPEIRL